MPGFLELIVPELTDGVGQSEEQTRKKLKVLREDECYKGITQVGHLECWEWGQGCCYTGWSAKTFERMRAEE